MPKTEKTIDGFAVRSAKDSKLVSRSSATAKKTSKTRKSTSGKTLAGVSSQSSKAKKHVPKNIKPRKSTSAKSSRASQPRASVDDFLSPVSAFSSENDQDKRLLSTSGDLNTYTSSEDIDASQESYIDSLSAVDSALSTEEDDDGLSELTPEELREMKQKSHSTKNTEKPTKKELKEAEKRAKREEKELKKQGKKKSPVKTFFKFFGLFLVLVLIGAGIYIYLNFSEIIKKITGGNDNLWSTVSSVISETYEPLKTDQNGRTNILVFGTSGYTMDGDVGDGYTHDGADLTDSIMVVSLDQNKGDIAIVSLPRDLKVSYACTGTGKVNEVYWCANMNGDDELAGATALQETIKEVLGIDVQYYAHINWGALVSVVDTLGGIQVTLDEDIFDYGWTDAAYEAGIEYTLNGEDALALARARHGTENGDFSRGNSQQKILVAIKDKIIEKGLGLTSALDIVNSLGDNLRSNFSVADIKTAMHLLETSDLDSIRQVPLVSDDAYYMTTASINGISYVIPVAGVGNYSIIKEYVNNMFNADPIPREAAKITVLNGAGIAGVASAEQAKLEAEGFRVQNIGDAPGAPEDTPYTKITIYDASEGKKPATLAALEKYYGVKAEPEANLPAGISGYGLDFIIIIGTNDNVQDE